MHFLELLWGTLVLRPYVFIFLAAFLFSGIISMGRLRTLIFLLNTWIIAYLSEFSSTRNGFPYGFYEYTGYTRGQELYIFNVPFMDSLSYSFLLYASFSMALFTLAPVRIRKWDFQIVDDFKLRGSWRVLILTTVYMMMVDVVIDPAALRGDRWFLGQIYHYKHEGYYFGVPLSNAAGWALVGFVALFLYQRIEKRFLHSGFKDKGLRTWPIRGLTGIGLYYGVLAFILVVTWWIGEYGLLIAGCFIYLLPTVILILRLFDSRNRASDQDWERHIREFKISRKQGSVAKTG